MVESFKALDHRRDLVPDSPKHRLTQALQRIIDLYDAWDKPSEAARWRAEMMELNRELGIVERPEDGVRPPGPRVDAKKD